MKCIVDWILNNSVPDQPVQIEKIILMEAQGVKHYLSSVEELIEILPTIETPILFIRNLSQMFRFIEPALLKAGYIPQMCQDHGKGFHVWTHTVKPFQYAPIIKGHKKSCSTVKFNNFKMYDADPWLGNVRSDLIEIQPDEADYLLKLSEMSELKSTPSGQAWQGFSIQEPKYASEAIYKNIKSGVRGGIIWGKKGFYKVAYHYDITSMYPFILSNIKKMPWPESAQELDSTEETDHENYAYWVPPDYHCDVTSHEVPAGTIRMLLCTSNPYANTALYLYQMKAGAKKGTLQYIISKLMVNSFIGRIIMRDDYNRYYKFCNSDTDVIQPSLNKKTFRHFEVYTYIIALARKYIEDLMKRAIAEGCRIIQVNTDGFFTDRPISFADKEKFLGSLRFEYEAHNLTIFACNQYACDEEVCIAGLPKELYKPGQTSYEFPIKVVENNELIWRFKTITLGAEE